MKLAELLEGIPTYSLNGHGELEVKGLGYDSRRIQPGDLFVAIKGHSQNGHDYLSDAIRNGAVALVAEEFGESYSGVSKIRVHDSRDALAKLAARFYGNPYNEVDIIGITGTNGKTTTSYILESILSETKWPVVLKNSYRTIPSPSSPKQSPLSSCKHKSLLSSNVSAFFPNLISTPIV